jgi:hypothetical protein
MLNANYNSKLAGALISASGEEFMLLDIGASGGISKLWDQFGERLRAVRRGFGVEQSRLLPGPSNSPGGAWSTRSQPSGARRQ